MLTKAGRQFSFKSVDQPTLTRIEAAFDQMFLSTGYGTLKKSVTFDDGIENMVNVTRRSGESIENSGFEEKLTASENFSFKRPIRIRIC